MKNAFKIFATSIVAMVLTVLVVGCAGASDLSIKFKGWATDEDSYNNKTYIYANVSAMNQGDDDVVIKATDFTIKIDGELVRASSFITGFHSHSVIINGNEQSTTEIFTGDTITIESKYLIDLKVVFEIDNPYAVSEMYYQGEKHFE